MAGRKAEIVTFKADAALADAMKLMPNRSEFIRGAILAALDNICPLCHGTGLLTAGQKNHWNEFAARHSVEQCNECHETYLVCRSDESGKHPG
jgi:hypothetical protein